MGGVERKEWDRRKGWVMKKKCRCACVSDIGRDMCYLVQDQPATSPVVLVVKFSDAIRRSLPVEMLNEENTVVLVTWPHTMARRNLEQLVRGKGGEVGGRVSAAKGSWH